ncbi:HpcH/HpaI aldolase/citrate lyase family protein [Glacieibacterium megasporae]|uniref:HpcH/HpaI aldolase/citrate lyase family protein n=1 Tax=Glacieibacterium megasporae TaxID=2835787 RepID=UPI001C1E2621|nr:CoA ester lyase [Polymorphobacter megasporae]UAJ08672.1 CoA ester lyase [Polymorphobacter megasporae]
MDEITLLRSVLFLPAANPRAIVKARTLDCDAVVLDLEDAVAPAAKPAARDAAVAAVREGGWGHRALLIRVNALGTTWSADDFAAIAGLQGLAGIVVPKVADAADAAIAVERGGGLPIWAMVETPAGIQAADDIAATPGITALVAGTTDLAADLHARPRPDRSPLLYSLSRIVVAARAARIAAFDGVFIDLGDATGLAAEATQGRDFGFDGKTLIHPGQIDVVNRVFSPSAEELVYAHGLIAAHEAARAGDRGVTTYAGKLVEGLHVAAAQRVLRAAEAIVARG